MNRSQWRTIVPIAVGVVAVAIAVVEVSRNGHAFAQAVRRMGWLVLVTAFVLGAGQVFALFGLWREILRGFGGSIPAPEAARVFLVSQVGKYLPGSVWPVLAQIEFGRRAGIGRRAMLSANVVVYALSLAVGLIISAIFLPLSSAGALRRYWWAFLLLPFLLVCLHPRAIPALLNAVFRRLGRDQLVMRLSVRRTLVGALWGVASWLLLGLHLWVLTHAVGAHGLRSLAAAVGVAAFAVAVGVLFVPAPAGAGVRDAVLVLTLAGSIGSS
ncbi:MAG: lysylphosphatidylglycerol synthase domain-containing protein, partial [Actinomycetota bacterium]